MPLMYSINSFLLFFIKKLRLSNPWNYKVPFLIAIPYLILLSSNFNTLHSLLLIILSLTIIFGVAGLGYLTNDLGDREKDKLINKENATSSITNQSIIVLFLFFISLTLLPWFYLPFNKYSFMFLSIQLFLFYAYAFPPFRLKEKGFLGILTDALYAHVMPAILASYTFYLVVSKTYFNYINFIIILCLWQFLLGIRNILFHQLKDYNNDISSNTNTFVTYYGNEKSEILLKRILLPLEFILFLLFCIYISIQFNLFICLVIAYWLYKAIKERKQIRIFNYRDLAYKFFDDLYLQWLPLVVIILLCIKSYVFIPIAILHFVLFRSEAKTFIINYIKK